MAELVLKKGDIVVATARKPEALDDLKAKYPATQLITIKLDVDKAQEITEAFAKAKAAFGRIDVVFNNAGWSMMGETEGVPEDVARKLFETNFWGASNVSREAVRFFREENKPSGGLLLNNSSLMGITAIPGMGYYSATKQSMLTTVKIREKRSDIDIISIALEGITQALALELDPSWNIKVSYLVSEIDCCIELIS